jgi:formylglycine-generating enzyme required for sulfatase activity
MASGESQKIHAKASVFGLGGGAGGESEVRRVKEEGNADACKESQRDQKMGDARCSVPLRIGLLELDAPSAPVCPEGSVLRGDQCERPATCAPGTQWNGTECVGHLAPARSGGSCPAGMAALPGGTFQMGDRGDIVSVQPFCMDVTEVTVSAFEMCISMGGCTAPYSYLANDSSLTNRSCNYKRPGSGNHPINCVTWDQAAAYCGWASKRLPSEEEWEWASRGASDGRTYPWGEAAPSPDRVNACGPECVSWVKENLKLVETAMYASSDGWPTTAPVGSFPRGATPQGLQDMAGNVWEWTASNYRDSFGRVLRGGSWMHGDASNLRAGDRNPIGPRLFEDGALGFRCAR